MAILVAALLAVVRFQNRQHMAKVVDIVSGLCVETEFVCTPTSVYIVLYSLYLKHNVAPVATVRSIRTGILVAPNAQERHTTVAALSAQRSCLFNVHKVLGLLIIIITD